MRKRFWECEHNFSNLCSICPFLCHTTKKWAKENVRKGSALTYPVGGRVLHAKNAFAFFAKRTRFEQSADFAFAASKRTAKTEIFLREEGSFSCSSNAKQFFSQTCGVGAPYGRCNTFGQNRTVKTLPIIFERFWGCRTLLSKGSDPAERGCRAAPCSPEVFSHEHTDVTEGVAVDKTLRGQLEVRNDGQRCEGHGHERSALSRHA